MKLDLRVADPAWKQVAGLRALARRAIAAAISETHVEVSLLLTSNAEVQEVNKQWRGKDYATNILSFPSGVAHAVPEGELRPLGDLVMAYEVVAQEAASRHKSIQDHITHLLVHGSLHLLGYDHETEAEADVMEATEIQILTRLGVENPYIS